MFKRAINIIIVAVLLLLPVGLLFVPLPLSEKVLVDQLPAAVLLAAYLLIIIFFLPTFLSFFDKYQRLTKISWFLLLLFVLAFNIFSLAQVITPAVYLAAAFVLISTLLNGIITFKGDIFKGSGILSFVAFVALILNVEVFLRSIPLEYWTPQIRQFPVLVRADRGIEQLSKLGFRGRRPCGDCGGKKFIRVVTMGGSSTYGVPMVSGSMTYSAYLQRLLDRRRPEYKFEVLNTGVAGYGIIQIIDSLKKVVLKYKPDVVTVCAWFNDSSFQSWYGIPGVSDREAKKRREIFLFIQNSSAYRFIGASRIYRLIRYYLQALLPLVLHKTHLGVKKRRRMRPKEFKAALEEFVSLSEKNNFLPVLVIEPLHRTPSLAKATERNRYYQAIIDLAQRKKVPLIDTATAYSRWRNALLFYDFIHPNPSGHLITAERIFEGLFGNRQKEEVKRFWKKRGKPMSADSGRRELYIDLKKDNSQTVAAELKVRGIYKEARTMRLVSELPEGRIKTIGRLSDKWQTFNFRVKLQSPLTRIVLKALPLNSKEQRGAQVGKTNVYTPVFLEVKSAGKNYGSSASIRVNGEEAGLNRRGYNIVVIDAETGSVLSRAAVDTLRGKREARSLYAFLERLAEKVNNLKHKLIVAVSVNTDGSFNIDRKKLSGYFKRIGASGNLPSAYQSFAIIGIWGAKPKTALEAYGNRPVELRVGDSTILLGGLFEVKNVRVVSAKSDTQ